MKIQFLSAHDPHLEPAHEVAREDRARLELAAARVDHADADLALARRRALPADLEEREVEVRDMPTTAAIWITTSITNAAARSPAGASWKRSGTPRA